LDGKFSSGREYAPGFSDAYYALTDQSTQNLRLAPQTSFTLEYRPFDLSIPFDSLSLTGDLLTPNGKTVPARLIPLGASILRWVTFRKG
jgi:hypothetical protein